MHTPENKEDLYLYSDQQLFSISREDTLTRFRYLNARLRPLACFATDLTRFAISTWCLERKGTGTESDTATIRESALQISTTFVSIVRLVPLCFIRIQATNMELNCYNGIFLDGSFLHCNEHFPSFFNLSIYRNHFQGEWNFQCWWWFEFVSYNAFFQKIIIINCRKLFKRFTSEPSLFLSYRYNLLLSKYTRIRNTRWLALA